MGPGSSPSLSPAQGPFLSRFLRKLLYFLLTLWRGAAGPAPSRASPAGLEARARSTWLGQACLGPSEL